MVDNYILADNQDLTRYAVENLIRTNGQNMLCQVTDKAALFQRLKEREDSVVVLDYTLFDFIDEDQLLIVSERFAETRWVLISEELTVSFMRRMIYSSHAFSIVFKDSPIKEIRDALLHAARGDRFICQRATEQVLAQHQESERPALLTATEVEIVRAIARGKTTKEIAAERISSVHTVNTHKKNIFRKLQVNTAHEAIKYALRAGLVDPSEFYI